MQAGRYGLVILLSSPDRFFNSRSRSQANKTGVTIRMCTKLPSIPPITGVTSCAHSAFAYGPTSEPQSIISEP